MTGLKERLRGDLKASMKAKDKARTNTIRMLLAAIQEEETKGAKKQELDEAGLLAVVAREIKRRRDSAQVYAEAGREDLAAAERAEAAILEEYQPAQLDEAELADLIAESIAQIRENLGEEPTMRQMGQVMREAKGRAAGRVEGKRLADAVKAALG